MSLIDKLAEKHIQAAIEEGQLDNLPGDGKPLKLDDNSFVPESLRASYRMLKNSGYLPPEMEQRKEALNLCELIDKAVDKNELPEMSRALAELRKLELKLRIKGIDTKFLHKRMRAMKFDE